MELVFVSVGSNLSEPLLQVTKALSALGAIPKTSIVMCSSYYRSRPLVNNYNYNNNQPDYLNAVVALETELTPELFLYYINIIEIQHGRTRQKYRFAPRTLDLDIVLFGTKIIATSKLTVPHYDMHNREFIIYPLEEIAPNIILPDGTSLVAIRRNINRNGMILWDDTSLITER
ncbi:2-amino-4-hydroxy-6-hydroxymethyldihydropteridine diphosphokinase [Candidatus Palibaumannia cicadellinicola]|uniref:2-amino-4-hydroxy-6-hydroxymethyldihydropteridine pyrophosphokinase n=1 Tax=Candidatus Palibaumannia cicadellinicola TaxID=186490 RepID=A0A0K2BL64_9GAMM|nr:2-amino-4-hydroxy-6-hydroxymethyldihydropteridine diphosphokinase [Candidatus Baumannia cicadellinicola]AKZ65798.1 2-amino-4-hydroxy-6- hydroxymethyldihydropteridine pyrophosphokinase [Candidatus Baumannia cicadellinicola]